MAGSISLSLSQQFDELGNPLSGGRLFFIQAGTTSDPQDAYKDTSLTLPHPNPITLDAAGRVPAFYLADGQIKIRLTNSSGVEQIVQDNLLVIGPSSGSGTAPSVDSSTVFQTGDVLWLDVAGTRTGWVRDNGRTIGSASSGATERANADTSALFVWLWNNFTNAQCPVSGGRGANGAADFAANKTITLPDKRGYIPGGLDDMGNSAAGRYANVPVVSGDVATAGSILGANTNTIATANLPPYTPVGSIVTTSPNPILTSPLGSSFQGGGALVGGTISNNLATFASTFTGTAQGGTSTALGNCQKTVLGTFFRKL